MNDEGKAVKYWFFHLMVPELRSKYMDAFDVTQNKTLYAYTDKKEIAKKFMKERNMKFFKVKTKHLSSEGIHYLADNQQSLYLQEFSGITKLNCEDDYMTYSIVMSIEEHNRVTIEGNFLLCSQVMKYVHYELLRILKPEVIELLGKLHYWQFYNPEWKRDYYHVLNADATEGLEACRIDELAMFIHLYGELLER